MLGLFLANFSTGEPFARDSESVVFVNENGRD